MIDVCVLWRFYKHSRIDDSNKCWQWYGQHTKYGYGIIRLKKERKIIFAHRIAYELANGPIPVTNPKVVIDHLCSNKLCVNPEHMELVTIGENVKRYFRKMQFCKHGHLRIPENFYYKRNKRVRCRPCAVQREREKRAKARFVRLHPVVA